MTLKVGDKVRLTGRLPYGFDHQGHAVPGAKGTIVRLGSTFPYRVVVDGHHREHWLKEHEVEKIEEPTPKFKVGDRVRLLMEVDGVPAGTVGTIIRVDKATSPGRRFIYRATHPLREDGHRLYEFRLEKVESVPFKLERGDKVVNRKTGREGEVIFGLVYDVDISIANLGPGVPARAIEEYEEWHPGTYDLIKKDAPW